MTKTKKQYRVWAKQTRNNLNIAGISSAICTKIQCMDEYKNANKIAAFYQIGKEIDLKPLFEDKNRAWYLPVVTDEGNMIFCKYENCSEMNLNRYGICEPCTENEIEPEQLDLIIIPALCVDKKGHRLGYGKGYYDRYLAKLPDRCKKIVPIAEELIVESLPCDEFDEPVDMAVTQAGVYNYK